MPKLPPAKPFLKWAGGKTQIMEVLMDKFPTTIRNYYEPFLGGGSVLLQVLTRVRDGRIQLSGNIIANDLNEPLIAVYRNIQSNWEAVWEEFDRIKQMYQSLAVLASPKTNKRRKITTVSPDIPAQSKEMYYYECREQYNQLTAAEKTTPRGSALFLFLNKTGFRGLFRVGSAGNFNVPFGNYEAIGLVQEDLLSVSDLIQRVEFRCGDYQDAVDTSSMSTADFVYLDPPYAAEEGIQSFVGYTTAKFPEHNEFFDWCKELPCKWMLSNANVTVVRNAFRDYPTDVVPCRRAIHSKNPEATANEVLIKNRG